MPASARIRPVRGSSAAIPPKRPASACCAAAWMRRSIELRTPRAGRGAADAIRLPAGEQRAARAAGQLRLERALEAGRADGRVRAGSRARKAAPGGPPGWSAAPTEPTMRAAGLPPATTRARAGPETIVWPLRDEDAARARGATVRRVSRSPGAQAREDEVRAPSRPCRPTRGRRPTRGSRRRRACRRSRRGARRRALAHATRAGAARWRSPAAACAYAPAKAARRHALSGRGREQVVHRRGSRRRAHAAREARGRPSPGPVSAFEPTITPATSATAASAGSARWVMRRRRSTERSLSATRRRLMVAAARPG